MFTSVTFQEHCLEIMVLTSLQFPGSPFNFFCYISYFPVPRYIHMLFHTQYALQNFEVGSCLYTATANSSAELWQLCSKNMAPGIKREISAYSEKLRFAEAEQTIRPGVVCGPPTPFHPTTPQMVQWLGTECSILDKENMRWRGGENRISYPERRHSWLAYWAGIPHTAMFSCRYLLWYWLNDNIASFKRAEFMGWTALKDKIATLD